MTGKKNEKHPHEHREDEAARPQRQPESPADELAALRGERDDLLVRLQRLSADYVNYQKRAGREIAEAREMANRRLIEDLLGVLDDLERAIDAASAQEAAGGQPDPMLAGIKLVHEKALKVLTDYGLSAIECVGLPFDPQRHQALMQEPSAECKAPTVLRELQRGYELKGRVIRPSSVAVSAPAEAPPQETPKDAED